MNLEQLLLEVLLEAEDSQSYKAALKNTGKDIKDGVKKLIGAANDAGSVALEKAKSSEALKKAKEELSNPENRKAVATKGKKAIGTVLKVLNSTMDTEKKRDFLKKYLVSKGVNPNQLISVSIGESQSQNANTIVERALARATIFKIITP